MNTIFCYFLCSSSNTLNNIWLTIAVGIACSFFAVLFYNLFQGYGIYLKMKKINGTYLEYDENGKQQPDSECTAELKFKLKKILLGSGPHLQINQIIEKRLWESILPLSVSNPLIAVGTYSYTKERTWGIQNIVINLKKEIIFVKSIDCIKKEKDKNPAEYWLKKKS
ncbi:hypothetical protein ES702_04420 [subsurface metagenome]